MEKQADKKNLWQKIIAEFNSFTVSLNATDYFLILCLLDRASS